MNKNKLLLETCLWGIATSILYFLLYYFEETLLAWSGGVRQNGWSFAVPVIVALVFSAIHGLFTNRFWKLLGIRAKKISSSQVVD